MRFKDKIKKKKNRPFSFIIKKYLIAGTIGILWGLVLISFVQSITGFYNDYFFLFFAILYANVVFYKFSNLIEGGILRGDGNYNEFQDWQSGN